MDARRYVRRDKLRAANKEGSSKAATKVEQFPFEGSVVIKEFYTVGTLTHTGTAQVEAVVQSDPNASAK